MIEFKSLEKTPTHSQDKSHYFCDYIELIVLCDGEDGVSVSDIYDRFLEDERIQEIGSDNGAEANEKWISKIEDWFSEIEARIFAYGDHYPFELLDRRLKLKSVQTDENLVYLGLLLCSSLSYLDKTDIFTSAFEYLSFCATKNYLPKIAEVHIFGVSSKNNLRYTGSLEKKIRKFAVDINESVSSKPNVFRDRDNGDGGLDIVAWVPFESDINLDKKQLFVGQSASGLNWKDKQASVDRLKNYINLATAPLNVLYVPFDFRDSERQFSENYLITSDLIFDRYRLIKLLTPDVVFDGELGIKFKSHIESAIEFEEDLV